MEEKVDEPDIEEQYGCVQEGGEHLDCCCQPKFFDALGEERTNARSFWWFVRPIGDLHVPASPLLHESRPQCAGRAHTKANEPQHVDAHDRRGRLEGGHIGEDQWDGKGRAIGKRCQLLRDLRKQADSGVGGVGLQALVADYDKSGHRRGEKTGLCR